MGKINILKEDESLIVEVFGMTSKYFNKVYCELINVARNKNIINYKKIANIMGLSLEDPMGNYWANETGKILGEICEYEHTHGRPMLSAIVVRTDTGQPGPGFSELARKLEKLKSSSPDDEKVFWEREIEEVYKSWS